MSLMVLAAIIVLILGTLYFLLDLRQTSETQSIFRYLLADARRRAMKKFTVIITLDTKADTLFPTLTHLHAAHYKKLQVIVVMKRGAGKKAQQLLTDFNDTFGKEKLSITYVPFARGLTTTTLARTHATGDYIFELDAHDRLSKRFFEIASQVLSVKQYDFLAVRVLVRPNKTFANAFWATTLLLRATIDASLGQGMPVSRVVARRKLLLQDTSKGAKVAADIAPEFTLHFAVPQLFIEALDVKVAPRSLSLGSLSTAVVLGLLFTAGYCAIWYFIDHSSAELYTSIAAITIELAALLFVVQARGYSPLDALNFVLFIPLAPLYALSELLRRLILLPRSKR